MHPAATILGKMRANFCAGVCEWKTTLCWIKAAPEPFGLERCIRFWLQLFRIACVSELIAFSLVGANEPYDTDYDEKKKRDLKWTEKYVLVNAGVLLAALVCWPTSWWCWPVLALASYRLFEMFVMTLGVVFLRTGPDEAHFSTPRSLALALINIVQIVVTFALFYRFSFHFDPWTAAVASIQVFATIGYHGLTDQCTGGSKLVVAQIAADFLFLTIFVASLIGRGNKQ